MFHAVLAKLFKTREQAARRFAHLGNEEGAEGGESAAVHMDGGEGGDDDDGLINQPFLEHLEDFRKLLFRLVITLMVALIACLVFNAFLLDLIQLPLKWGSVDVPVYNEAGDQTGTRRTPVDELVEVRSIQVTGTFMLTIRLAFICGAVLTFPLLVLMLLKFFIPGLGHRARKTVLMIVGASMGLLVFGLLFAFVGVLPRIMEYFYLFGAARDVQVDWTIENYVKFSSRILVVFAVSFQLPLLVLSLVKIDVLSFELMHRTRSFAIIGIAVMSGLLTPPDVLTLGLMAVPMVILYEICIWLAWLVERRDRRVHPEYYEDENVDENADGPSEPSNEEDTK